MSEHVITINGVEYGIETIAAVYSWADLTQDQFMGADEETQERFVNMFNEFNQLTAEYDSLPDEVEQPEEEEELF